MKKLYLITYALVLACASLCAQNAKNINQATKETAEITQPITPENVSVAETPVTTSHVATPQVVALKLEDLTTTTPATPKSRSSVTAFQPITPLSEVNPTVSPVETPITVPPILDTSKVVTSESSPQEIVSPGSKEHTMINIGLDTDTRQHIAAILHKLLANEYALYAKTQKYHWNIKGKFFGSLHILFQKQYETLAEIIDHVAERSLALGIPSIGGLKELTALATIPEETNENRDDMAMIKQLLTDHEIIIKYLRVSIDTTAKLNDMGTNNFLSDLITKHEKIAWMLRAHLQ